MKFSIYKYIIIVTVIFLISVNNLFAQEPAKDTISVDELHNLKEEQFYDSLKVKASHRKITKWFYDFLITPPRPYVDKKELALNYYSQMEGKIISEIHIKALDVFGPTFQDTARKATKWVERAANVIHTKSNLKSIEKMLLFKVGDQVNPELLYENERLIRTLPYIKEITFILEQDSVYPGLVKVNVLTKDRFSFGASGSLSGVESAALEVYNQNVFGIGHEISLRFVGHVNKQPYLGLETYYKIKNINGSFLDASVGYLNTYKNEGFTFLLNKSFFTPSVKWGYGATFLRIYKSDRIFNNDPVISPIPLDLLYYGGWGGKSFQIRQNTPENAQIVLSGGVNVKEFNKRSIPETGARPYFANSTFLLSSITFSQRRYVQDELVYSYGITEDIPEGFKNEIVYGYDFNEFGNRHYAHLLISNGNLLINRSGYLYLEGDIGGYFKHNEYQQGLINAKLYFISKQIHAGRKTFRLFTRTDYTIGFNRVDQEALTLNRDISIRGFSSREVVGQQRLRLNLEYVLFLRREFYKFNVALFGFADVGVIGAKDQFILSQNYYSGLGAGIRIHNENLVLKTFQLRFAFYPFHPADMSLFGFVFEEQSKRQFYSFEPTQPLPIPFE